MSSSSLLSSKVLVRVGAGAAVVAVVLVAALVWHASNLEVREGVRGQVDVVPIDAWVTSSGYAVVGWDGEADDQEIVLLSDDGTVLDRRARPGVRLAQVSDDGDVLFFDDYDVVRSSTAGATALEAHRVEEGELVEAWTRAFHVDGSDDRVEELSVVAHAPGGETVVFGCGEEVGCWLFGVDAAGDDLWALDSAELRPASPADRSARLDRRPWLVPEESYVIRSRGEPTDGENRPILRVDPATGQTEEVTTGARVVSGQGFAVVSRFTEDGCGLEVVSDGEVTSQAGVPCGEADGTPIASVLGNTATVRAGDELVLFDLVEEATGTVDSNRWTTTATGVGTVLVHEPRPEVVRPSDGHVVYEVGSGWTVPEVGIDAVVLRQTHHSSNPLAADPSTEVLVVDAADGSVCARARFDGRPDGARNGGLSFIALPGCAALVEVEGTIHLLGR